MTLLEQVPDLDCRRYKKEYGNPVKNEKDFEDWKNCHELEYKWQHIIRKKYLHHFHPIRAYDLAIRLRQDYLLGWESIYLILTHLIRQNRFVEVDKLDQDDERRFMLYLYHRLRTDIQVPHSVLSSDSKEQ